MPGPDIREQQDKLNRAFYRVFVAGAGPDECKTVLEYLQRHYGGGRLPRAGDALDATGILVKAGERRVIDDILERISNG